MVAKAGRRKGLTARAAVLVSQLELLQQVGNWGAEHTSPAWGAPAPMEIQLPEPQRNACKASAGGPGPGDSSDRQASPNSATKPGRTQRQVFFRGPMDS